MLRQERPRDAIKALNTLPKDMSDAYTEVLARIDKNLGRDTALQVLSWIFHAQRPLQMAEIRELLSIETQSPDTELYPEYFIDPIQIIRYCQGLVELDHHSGIIRFTHYTVQEFLKENYLDKILVPADLAKVCLTYLNFDIFDCGPCPDSGSLDQRRESYRFSDYAVKYWGTYIRGKAEEDDDIFDALLNLFKSSNKCNAIHQHRSWIN